MHRNTPRENTMQPNVSSQSSLQILARAMARSAKACIASSIVVVSLLTHANAREVILPYKGLTLNANLELATGKKPADGVILITHGGLGHHGMEVITYLQKLLKDRGYNTLAINLSLGLNHRHGMYDCAVIHRHANDDAVAEIGAWVGWLKKQGATRVVLLGHSRGGAQTALYATEAKSPLVKAVVLLAPATRDNTDTATYLRNFNKPLGPLLEKAQSLHNTGKGSAVLEHIGLMNCADTSATVDTFISYYAQDPDNLRLDTPSLLPKIKFPVLVLVAGNDEVVIGLEKKIEPMADGKRVQMKIIEGADHLLRDLSADESADAIDSFLKDVGYASRNR